MVVSFASVTLKNSATTKSAGTSRVVIINLLLGSFAFIGVVAADRARAADIAPIEYAVPSDYNWVSFYAGGHLGYAWGSSNWTAPGISGSFNLSQSVDTFAETGSFFAGLQAGYNYMLPNRVVIGVEADASFPAFPNLAGI